MKLMFTLIFENFALQTFGVSLYETENRKKSINNCITKIW